MISGLLVINKEKNITSHDVVAKIRSIIKTEKVGHFGTLDPMAEGILLIGIGRVTKFFDFYIQKKKLYTGKIKFGFATETYDREGKPISEKKEVDLNRINLPSLLSDFRGTITQVPPSFSAKKYKGKPLYVYARAQKKIVLNPVKITIYELKAEILEKDTLWFEALTSAGTYIRSLAHDMGQKLGVGAHLEELFREKIGEFDKSLAISSKDLNDRMNIQKFKECIIPIESLLPEFSKIIVNQAGRRSILNGLPLQAKNVIKIFSSGSSTHFRLFDQEGRLLSIAQKDKKIRQFNPVMVFPDL